MGYATIVDLDPYCPARIPFTTTTKPSATAVAALCDDANAQVDRTLIEAGYAVPIPTTATLAYEIVKITAAKVAAALVEQVAPQSDRETRAQMMAEHALSALMADRLPGVAKDATTSAPRWRPSSGTGPIFTRDMVL